MTDTASTKIMLKKLKELNTIWHPDSTLVFKSKDEKLVIGRWVDSTLVDLDDTAIQLCETWKFKIDESMLDQSDGSVLDGTDLSVGGESVEQNVETCLDVDVVSLPMQVRDAISNVEEIVGLMQKELDDTKRKLRATIEELVALQAKFSALKNLLA